MADGPKHQLGQLMERSNPQFETVMSCVFGIEDHETRTYLAVLERPGCTIDELTGSLERDRSTVNRSLATLYDRGFVDRDRRLIDGGGYVYQYTAIAPPEMKAMLHEALDVWAGTVHGVIDEFDGERGTE